MVVRPLGLILTSRQVHDLTRLECAHGVTGQSFFLLMLIVVVTVVPPGWVVVVVMVDLQQAWLEVPQLLHVP